MASADTVIHYLDMARDRLVKQADAERTAYDQGFEAGRRSVVGPGAIRPMTGQQFMARMMTQISPDSPGWATLHRLAEQGFGRAVVITDVQPIRDGMDR